MLRLEHKLAKKHSAHLAYRINAVLLLGTGWTLEQASNALLLDIETLRSYIQKFEEGGLRKLLEKNHHDKQSFLTSEQKIALTKHLELTLYRTTADVILYVKNIFGIVYSRSGMTRLLHELDFSYKKPKLVPSGLDVQAQEDFIAYFEQFMKNKDPDDAVVFYDSSHPQFEDNTGFLATLFTKS